LSGGNEAGIAPVESGDGPEREAEKVVGFKATGAVSTGLFAVTVERSERAAAASDSTNIVAINSQMNPAITINVSISASFPPFHTFRTSVNNV
jgi:hypothetical protein